MNTVEYLDAAKRAVSVESDYALAKQLGVRTSTISNYRSGRSQMDDEMATKVAAAIGVHPGLVILDMHRERAKTPAERSVWSEIYKGFLTLLPRAKFVGPERRSLPRRAATV